VGKNSTNIWATYVIEKTDQSKQSPNRRKFAQSGRPEWQQQQQQQQVNEESERNR
jgi:hypothetical protein